MKLKEAVIKARKKGFKWIAADSNPDAKGGRIILAFQDEPFRNERFWLPSIVGINSIIYIGEYTGNKDWTETKRQV